MKKFFIIVFIFVALLTYYFFNNFNNNFYSIFCGDKDATFCYVVSSNKLLKSLNSNMVKTSVDSNQIDKQYAENNYVDVSNKNNIYYFNNTKIICNGSKQFIYFKTKNEFSNLNKIAKLNVQYYQVSVNCDYNYVNKLIKKLNAKVIFCEEVNSVKVMYLFSNNFKEYKVVNNKKVNFQLAYKNNNLTVGYPLIYGSF